MGYLRISGEILKLGTKCSKGCVFNILLRNRIPPFPRRKGLIWAELLAWQAEVLLCLDLFAKEVWTATGLQTAYVLFAIHPQTQSN